MKKVYLDYAATTPVDPQVIAAMEPYFFERFGNASSLHAYGQEAKKALEDSRQALDLRLMALSGSVMQDGGEPVAELTRHLASEDWERLVREFLLA